MEESASKPYHLALADPTLLYGVAGQAWLQRAADAHSAARREAAARSGDEEAREALRTAFLNIPGVQDAMAKQISPIKEQPRLFSGRTGLSSQQPLVRLGSHVITPPPFLTAEGEESLGNNTIATVEDPSGHVRVQLNAGESVDRKLSNGSASAWAAVGQAVVIPAGVSTVRCQISCNFNWSCRWSSNWWREAKGNVWIGMAMNRLRLDGSFIDQPVAIQTVLYEFDDYNWRDDDYRLGHAISYRMSSAITTPGSQIVQGWLWVGSYANAQPYTSTAQTEITALLRSLEIDAF